MHTYFGAKKKNTKKIQQLAGTCISETTVAFSFKFSMQGCVYARTKIIYVNLIEINPIVLKLQ